MEVAIYGGLTLIVWVSSATVLLPLLILLKYSKFIRNWWFSFTFMESVQRFFEPKLIPLRKKTFKLLSENLSERDASKPLKVLEIGIGSGANLQFYPENSHLTALDMNVNFDSYFQQNQKKYSHIVYERTIISVAENMEDVDDCSMDVVISTYLLCSVTNLNDVMKEVKRVLKPGGKFLFLEHVTYPKSEWGFVIQKLISPLWFIYFDGCCLLRDIEDVIRNSGFSDVVCEKEFPQTLLYYSRPHIYGLATK